MSKYYCNQKFWWLSVDLGKFQTYSCCAATPQRVDLSWMKQNPGQIFNTPILQQERQMMLEDKPVSSCNSSCWIPESQGMPSRRTTTSGTTFTHQNIISSPETLNVIVGTDCNMTCVYCCKFYSTAWSKDVAENSYPVDSGDDRFVINSTDRILPFISQKEIATSSKSQFMTDEIIALSQSSSLKEIMITGGEPFLYLDLHRLIESISDTVSIKIFSGLGVNEKRFSREIQQLPKNTKVVISAESVGDVYEFIRYGNTWKRLNNNIEQLQKHAVDFEFNATVTNLTAPGLKNFIEWAKGISINFQPCTDPDYLAIGVLDPETKKNLQCDLDYLPDFVAPALEVEPDGKQVYNCKSYIREFARRRSLRLDVFPPTLAAWLGQ